MSAGRSPRPVALGLVPAALVILADQASKDWILTVVAPPPGGIRITDFFNLVLAWNRGVSFSLFAGDDAAMPYVLMAVAVAIVCGLVAWLRRVERGLVAVAIGLVIGGAIGNVIDRLRVGAVADFLDFHLGDHHFAAFNLADSAITIGVMLILADGLLMPKPPKPDSPDLTSSGTGTPAPDLHNHRS